MKEDTIDIELPAERSEGITRECHMSQELFQNARQTMGELRDFMRETGVSWEVLQQNIDRARRHSTAIERVIDRMDDYTVGLGHSLHDKPSNIRN